DNWNGGTSGYTIGLQVPSHLYAQIGDRRVELEKQFHQQANNLAGLYENEHFDAVVIVAEMPENDDWREGAKAWLRGSGVNNQGRVRSDNVAPVMVDGLLFRSQPEVNLYRALRAAGICLAPLPVFVRGGEAYRRIEPDFVLVKDGLILV